MQVGNIVLVVLLQILILLPRPLFAANYQTDQSQPQASALKQPATSGYAVQVGVFRTLEYATSLLESIGPLMPGLRIVKVLDTEGKSVYRITSLSFATREDADRATHHLRARNIPIYIYPVEQLSLSVEPGSAESASKPSTKTVGVTPGQGARLEPATPLEQAKTLALSQDDARPDQQYTTTLFGRPLTIGGEIGSTSRYRRNFNLDDTLEDDDLNLDVGLKLEFLYSPTDEIFVFVDGTVQAEADLYREDGEREQNSQLRRGRAWVYLDRLFDTSFDLQVGRQDFEDKREWWWDENLDAVRFHFQQQEFQAEIGVAEELGRISTDKKLSPEADDVTRLIGRATWIWATKQRLELFLLNQNDHSGGFTKGSLLPESDEDEVDADLNWYGVRAMGRVKAKSLGRLYYWADYGIVRGEESVVDFDDTATPGIRVADDTVSNKVDGWGVDVGVTLQTQRGKPTFTLGYARGSGDGDPTDGTDHAFRQTGLHDNNARFRGVNSFHYYGELLRPELSNLQIATVSLGFPLLSNSSVEVLYHHYQQVDAAADLRGDRLKASPLGVDRSIGSEIDIVVGIEEWKQLEVELVFGLFRAGNAFGPLSDEVATVAILKLDYNF